MNLSSVFFFIPSPFPLPLSTPTKLLPTLFAMGIFKHPSPDSCPNVVAHCIIYYYPNFCVILFSDEITPSAFIQMCEKVCYSLPVAVFIQIRFIQINSFLHFLPIPLIFDWVASGIWRDFRLTGSGQLYPVLDSLQCVEVLVLLVPHITFGLTLVWIGMPEVKYVYQY